MHARHLNRVAIFLWITFLANAGQRSAMALQQSSSLSPTAQTQAQIDRLLQECEEFLKKARYDDVATTAQEAVGLSRTLGDKSRLAQAYNKLGAAHFYRNRVEEALEAFKQVDVLAGETGDEALQARAANNIGTVLRNLGRFDEAVTYLNRSLAYVQRIGPRGQEAQALRNLAILYAELGDYDRAESLLQKGLGLSRELKDKKFQELFLSSLGVVEKRREHFQISIRYFEEALALDSELNLPGMKAEMLNNMAETYAGLGERRKAIEFYKQSVELAHAGGTPALESIASGNIGGAEYELGHLPEALDWLKRAHALLLKTGDFPEKECVIDVGIARVERALDHPQEALASYREAMIMIERLRAGAIPTETSRAVVFARRRAAFVEAADLLVTLHRESEAFKITERGRARAFLDLLAESRIRVDDELTAPQREREEHLLERIAGIQKELWNQDLPPKDQQPLKDRLTAAENDLETFRLELRRVNPRYASIRYPEFMDVERIQKELLGADSALVEFLLGEKRSLAWVISKDKITAAILPPRREIEEQLSDYRKGLTAKAFTLTMDASLRELDRHGRKLYQSLLQPLEESLSTSHKLIIVPDGVLGYLPFETLVPGAGRLAASATERSPGGSTHYLFEQFEIVYAPSATALAAIRAINRPAAAPTKMLLAFGDPIFGSAAARAATSRDADTSRSTSPAPAESLARYAERGFSVTQLPYTRAEVLGISQLYPDSQRRVYLGEQAREETLKSENLEQYRYIHFASHGWIDEEVPARSGILFSASADSPETNVLQVNEIMRLRLNADLVTLSACSTGLGKLLDGEGLMGLTRAFLYAGARNVVVSLWNVNDSATAQLMKAFYGNLNRGLSKSEALRRARLALLTSDQKAWRHPYFWAAFVLVGLD